MGSLTCEVHQCGQCYPGKRNIPLAFEIQMQFHPYSIPAFGPNSVSCHAEQKIYFAMPIGREQKNHI